MQQRIRSHRLPAAGIAGDGGWRHSRKALFNQVVIDAGLRQLQTLPGIGRWTANYFALRGWQAKDIFQICNSA
jgi:3-methyladenine DNA glycosylase/8-oxoguanine DNA glycosylase